jgi:hypothetical protein
MTGRCVTMSASGQLYIEMRIKSGVYTIRNFPRHDSICHYYSEFDLYESHRSLLNDMIRNASSLTARHCGGLNQKRACRAVRYLVRRAWQLVDPRFTCEIRLDHGSGASLNPESDSSHVDSLEPMSEF